MNENEIQYGLGAIEQMKQWENRLKGDQGSTIVVEDNKKMLNLGPRAIKQLTGTVFQTVEIVYKMNIMNKREYFRRTTAKISNGPVDARGRRISGRCGNIG